jgi:hypothetical protein
MSDGTLARSYGKVFDEIALEYDRNRTLTVVTF